jgi:hypothetical protein
VDTKQAAEALTPPTDESTRWPAFRTGLHKLREVLTAVHTRVLWNVTYEPPSGTVGGTSFNLVAYVLGNGKLLLIRYDRGEPFGWEMFAPLEQALDIATNLDTLRLYGNATEEE